MNNDYNDDARIPVKVPVIIEKDRFLRVSVHRTCRSPSKKAPPDNQYKGDNSNEQ